MAVRSLQQNLVDEVDRMDTEEDKKRRRVARAAHEKHNNTVTGQTQPSVNSRPVTGHRNPPVTAGVAVRSLQQDMVEEVDRIDIEEDKKNAAVSHAQPMSEIRTQSLHSHR